MAARREQSLPEVNNPKAGRDYFIGPTYEAGIVLRGTEVKSLRAGRANIAESYAAVEGDEIVLINADIPPYAGGNRFNHEPRRPRKLLLHRKQIDKLCADVEVQAGQKVYWFRLDEKGEIVGGVGIGGIGLHGLLEVRYRLLELPLAIVRHAGAVLVLRPHTTSEQLEEMQEQEAQAVPLLEEVLVLLALVPEQ